MESSPQVGGPPVAVPAGDPRWSVALTLVSTEARGFQVREHAPGGPRAQGNTCVGCVRTSPLQLALVRCLKELEDPPCVTGDGGAKILVMA